MTIARMGQRVGGLGLHGTMGHRSSCDGVDGTESKSSPRTYASHAASASEQDASSINEGSSAKISTEGHWHGLYVCTLHRSR